ncbi:MAG: hypothetical protein ACREUU_10230 [Gammaproteobacteria bacterium]
MGDPLNGISALTDPFPLRADGTRVLRPLLPAREGMERVAFAGRNFQDFLDFDTRHARVQRWRVSIQRQLGKNMVVEAAYAGSYGDRVYIERNINPLPGQYWADGLSRRSEVPTYLNANLPNPFRITNFEDLRASNPTVFEELAAQSFFTNSTQPRHRLLRPFPHMTTMTEDFAPDGKVRTASLEFTFQRRFSKGLTINAGYTRLRNKAADWFANEFDEEPTWRLGNNGRPHRFTATGIYQLPFGKRRAFLKNGVLSKIFGGFQTAVTYEYQLGALLTFGNNLFYYGDLNLLSKALKPEQRTLDQWFNTFNVRNWYAANRPGVNPCATAPARQPRTEEVGFETCANYGPDSYHRRVFPSRVEGVRADSTNQWNVNLQREFPLTEKVKMFLRLDALNLQNRSRFNAPSTDPNSTNFGRVTSQSAALNRFYQLQARIQF